ncbi:MAG: transpeptidase family protein [Candidatus Hydrogenedentes bacterium]|nr:transpeptidase family protein [Candidatus Hydrogenedentota bacterium]
MATREHPSRALRTPAPEAPNKTQIARMRLVTGLLAAGFLVIILRLCVLHLLPHEYIQKEELKHVGQVEIREPRGDILDRHGRLLATDRRVPSIWADPRYIRDPQRVSLLLSLALDMTEEEVLQKLALRDQDGEPRKFVWIKRWLLDESNEAIEKLIKDCDGGVAVQYEPMRYYPQGESAAHILGYVNRVGVASDGLELAYDEFLHSTPGKRRTRVDAKRNVLSSLTLEYVPPVGGDDLHLTIDTAIQHKLEQELDKAMAANNANRSMGIVMDPHTGAILALACRPAFDPNSYSEFDPELIKNRAIIDVFEPGSAFKIVTATAALEHELVTPETVIDCEGGRYNPYGHTIKDVHRMDAVPFLECFTQSSNIAMVKVARDLGPDRLKEWILRFGFGVPTSHDFRGESSGIFARSKWSKLTMGALPIGQEIAVTMLQLARSFAIIANGGYMVEPYFVESASTRDGYTSYQARHEKTQRIMSEQTAATMRDLCWHVVHNGTGRYAQIPEYRAGGKTGTAQIAKPGGGGYEPDKFTTVFAGFAPVNDPRIVSVIVVHEPMIRLHFGGYVCGPVFKEVVREALINMGVPEDPMPETEEKQRMELAKLEAAAADADTVIDRTEVEPVSTAADQESMEIADAVEFAGPKLPDFTGYTKAQARSELLALGLSWDPQGAGRVVSQYPPAGTPLQEVSLCRLYFASTLETAPAEEDKDAVAPTM